MIDSPTRHFLDLDQFSAETLRQMITSAGDYKAGKIVSEKSPANGKVLALVFEKPSTRTRVSFEVGMMQMGGIVTSLDVQSSQLGRGESIADTARVLSGYADAIMFRTLSETSLIEMAKYASVPVINGLTDKSHPCQIMADILTFEEHIGPIKDRVIAWIGDGNNVCASWIHAASLFGYTLRIATPKGYAPDADLVARAIDGGAKIELSEDPAQMVAGADCVTTDTWLSMGNGDGPSPEEHIKALSPYRVDEALMAGAGKDAIFMHCLPASRDHEVSAGVIDGPSSVVWDEAENRMHAQKGILHWCLSEV
ncbi:MAG: ornithine carbamoyltransferase [Rhodospirillales bacterium]|jgi:ornithine carbamoyltransferase|nr:ornithine carbamoyltransferase [Rhodospirillales bacterium]MBT5075178.1 ornithine carbamoyltransferase [Rhodospirillales bacterium]MBT5113041.1 ornithine carbamoyltransferase [Rhodospirillales bacterium]MBT5672917.1 ornithine carbamoyltransferase [Rhodospirillales bacterium]MBT6187594.1 ornithine carbamoyltransferase [Rhodospirillales bacterium]